MVVAVSIDAVHGPPAPPPSPVQYSPEESITRFTITLMMTSCCVTTSTSNLVSVPPPEMDNGRIKSSANTAESMEAVLSPSLDPLAIYFRILQRVAHVERAYVWFILRGCCLSRPVGQSRGPVFVCLRLHFDWHIHHTVY